MEDLLSPEFTGKLERLAKESSEIYKSNEPFPHIYFDDFLPIPAAEAALRDFPQPKELKWNEFQNDNERKLAFDLVENLPASSRDVLYFLNSRPMLRFLETLTGIKGLTSDPYYAGGGLHQIKPGGKLAVHADFNWHPELKLDRRINVLIYLNKDWKEEYGGHLELWKRDMSMAGQKILPLFNRCAIFNTTSSSYHGHPNPLACPSDRTRKSIATYYYSNGRPQEEVREAHSTIFPQQQRTDATVPRFQIRRVMQAITPPVLVGAYKSFRK
jgi:Rps23 Pro-64 3,4-dihydroxylase Tpa1-like proline 4-hydroxylase